MQPLGLGSEEEAIYRALLRHPRSSTVALEQLVGGIALPLPAVLDSLLRRGLIAKGPDAAGGWQATAPDVAIELLLMERQAELNEARRILPQLQSELARDSSTAVSTDVQVVAADAQAQLQAYLSLYEHAHESVDSLLRPPFIVAAPEAMQIARTAARKRGVRMRTIVATEVLQWAGWKAAIAHARADGEEVRVLDAIPFKLVLVDQASAMLPLHADDPEGPALRIGNVAVLSAVVALFDQLWNDAVPIHDMAERSPESAAGDPSLQELAAVLASGVNDKMAAHILGVSDRTLQRRIAALAAKLKARSRFQAGWLAARSDDK